MSFSPGPLPLPFNAQALIIREQLGRPQVLATNRHVTGGGPDLLAVQWSDGVITGRSAVVGGEPYEIYFTEPDGWALFGITCIGAAPVSVERRRGYVRAGCASAVSGPVSWSARFDRVPGT